MVAIRLFGELAAEADGEPVALPASRKAGELLAWLAVHPGAHDRSRLAAAFWPDVPDSSARASLRSAIWALRTALGGAGDRLLASRDSVELADVAVDVREFDELVAAGRFGDAERLCRVELLHRFDAEWVFDLREEYDARRAAVLARLAESADDPAVAAEWARRWATLRPLDEAAAGTLIRLLLATGERAAAVAAYRRLEARLRAELDVSPTRETAALLFADEPAPAPPKAAAAERDGPGLAGRERELGELLAVWRRAATGAGRTVALSGDGGIGKSRLAAEVCARATRDGAVVAVGAANGFGPAEPFGPWTELVAGLVDRLGPLPREAGWPADLARVVRAVGEPAGAPTEPDFDRVRFFEAVVELLAWASRRHPLVLLVEDLQLADSSSLELAAYAGRRLTRLPALLVLTRRRLPPRPDVDGMLGALRARGALAADLELAPLPPATIRRLVAGLPEARVARIVEVAGGNPLIALETAAAPAADPAAGLQGATRAAISRLRAPARLFVELVAAAGRDLDRAEVAALPLVGDPARAAGEALGAGLLRARDGAIGFRHALLSDAVYRDLTGPLRSRLHGDLADALRRRPGRRNAAEVARHLLLAGRDDLAVTHLRTAAAQARTVAALPEAATFLTEVTALDPDDPDPWVELAEVQAWRGLLAESDAAFDEALTRIPRADTAALAGAWLNRGRWLRGGICHPRESRRSYRAALDVLEIDAPDPLARAEALAGLAWAEAVSGDPAAVDGLLAEVDAVPGKPDLLSHDVGIARGNALLRAGRFTDSYAPLTAAATAANRAGRPDMAYSCLASAACAAACAGEFERALDFAERCLPLVVPTGLLRLGVYAHSARATVLRRLGRLEEARAACDRAAAIADRVGLADLEALVRYDHGMLAHAAGDWAAAARELGAAADARAPVSLPLARLYAADALARGGHPEEAETELRATALEPVTAGDFPETLVARMAAVQARIARARGDVALAEARFREAERAWRRCAERAGDPGAGYVAALVDLGRPPISVFVEPERELAAVRAELEGSTRADLR